MKYFAIALLFFLIQCSASIVNATFIFTTVVQPQSDWIASVDKQQLANASYVQGDLSQTTNFGFGDFVKGIFYFVEAAGLGIISVPYTLSNFGMQSPFTYFFSVPVYFMYFLAIAQFVANRSMRSMT